MAVRDCPWLVGFWSGRRPFGLMLWEVDQLDKEEMGSSFWSFTKLLPPSICGGGSYRQLWPAHRRAGNSSVYAARVGTHRGAA